MCSDPTCHNYKKFNKTSKEMIRLNREINTDSNESDLKTIIEHFAERNPIIYLKDLSYNVKYNVISKSLSTYDQMLYLCYIFSIFRLSLLQSSGVIPGFVLSPNKWLNVCPLWLRT